MHLTEPGDSGKDPDRQAGASDIEITAEMIRVGAAVLADEAGVCGPSLAEELAELVFEAMIAAYRAAPPPAHEEDSGRATKWSVGQAGADVEIMTDGVIVGRIGVEDLEEIASEIGEWADANISDYHCISAVAVFLSVLQRNGWGFSPPDADAPSPDAAGSR